MTSNLAFCATRVLDGSANAAANACTMSLALSPAGGAREKRSSDGDGAPPRGTATYQARPGSTAKLIPTRAAVRASVPVVSVSNAKRGAASSSLASARAPSSVVTRPYRCGTSRIVSTGADSAGAAGADVSSALAPSAVSWMPKRLARP